MTRGRIARLLVLVAFILFIAWIANHTYWDEIKVPMPPKGEAARNPFYAAQRFSEALGARTRWDRIFTTPPRDAVMVVAAWNWGLSDTRRTDMERWVASGGRLVVDRSLLTGNEDFESWSGLRIVEPDEDDEEQETPEPPFDLARLEASRCRAQDDTRAGSRYRICDLDRSYLSSAKRPTWELRDERGPQVLRVAVGKGSVTMINAVPFMHRDLFEGDHARLFAAATQLRAGDEIRFLSEDSHDSLLELMWRYGAPVVVIGLLAIALALWRGGVRFGPLVAATEIGRRSLAEQIRGTGMFAVRFGGGQALHAAAARALNEAARRRISAYESRSGADKIEALVRATGFAADDIKAALNYSGPRRSNELRSAIALLEAARRRILVSNTGSTHGNRSEHDNASR